MELIFTEKIVKVAFIMTLFVIILRSEIIEKGIPLTFTVQKHTIQDSSMEVDRMRNLGRDICYCVENMCAYCPDGLFCNNQKSGCCPQPDSDNECGIYCVPPGYTCCSNEGTCRNDYPTCCHDHCCKQKWNCCGEGCCSKKSKCCKNNKNKYFCISKQTEVIDSSPDYCLKDKCDEQHEEQEMLPYFSKLCSKFKKTTKTTKINLSQFAVLTLNEAEDEASTNQFDPFPLIFKLEDQTGNYASATPKVNTLNITDHAEMRILTGITDRIKWFQEHKPQSIPYPPTIYLFTYLSPCTECLDNIISVKQNSIQGASMFIGWHLIYSKMSQEMFLNGLKLMMDHKITFVFSTDKTCENEKNGPGPLVQPTLLNDLENKYNVDKFCETKLDLHSSLVRLVNLLVWRCKGKFKTDRKEETKTDVIDCMHNEINSIHPKINPCMDLSDFITNSINNLFSTNKGKNLLLSPPLNPKSLTISISNDINDLTANYADPYFCFQVNVENEDL